MCATHHKRAGSWTWILFVLASVATNGPGSGTTPALARETQEAGEPGQDFFDMSIEELLNVEISAPSKKAEPILEAPAVATVVPREEFEMYGDRNLHQLMQRQPSVYAGHSFAFSDNLAVFRGDMSTHQEKHTLILFNGRPIRESALGYSFPVYMAFPLTNLGGVEIIRGPGSVLYGTNAFTGVVNLKTRPIPARNEMSLSGMGGSYGYYDTTLSAGGHAGDLAYVADLRAVGQDGWPYRFTDQTGVYDVAPNKDRSLAAVTHLAYRNLTWDVFAADVEFFTLGAMPLWSNTYHQSRTRRLFTNVGYQLPLHERVTLEFNATYNLQEDIQSIMADRRVGTNTSDLLGEATLFVNPWDRLNVVLGYLQEYRSNHAPDSEYVQSIQEYDYHPRSAYAQADYKVGEIAKLIAGTQWNESPLGDSDLVSRYGVILTPSKTWGAKLLRGEAFRGPITVESDLYDPPFLGNGDLEPETITTYEAQLFYHDKDTYAAVTYFDSTTDGMIVYAIDGNEVSYANGGEQRFKGIELEAKRFFTPHWHVLGSFLHQDNEADEGLYAAIAPADLFKLGTGYAWEGGSASVFYYYYGTPPTTSSSTPAFNPEPEDASLVSVNVRLDISKWVDQPKGRAILTLRGENLLDQDIYVPNFASADSYPYGPGRTVYAGLIIHF